LEHTELTSPRAWLEHLPNGAYTVVRCDFSPCTKRSKLNNQRAWRIFGQPFHLKRLKSSYKTFEMAKQLPVIEAELNTAEKLSERLLHILLREAEMEFSKVHMNNVQEDKQRENFTIMVTLLWHSSSEVVEKICVKGHACSIRKLVDPSASYPHVVKVAIATRSYLPPEASFPSSKNDDVLPSRQPAPEAKLSSWCTERRPLEMEFLKRGDSCVNDIILCRASTGSSGVPSLKLLEGLTSNLFVRLEDGVLMTADVERDGVLGGYARDVVLQQAQKMGLSVRLTAPVLEESHFWKEVFLTSSIKLIVPVDHVKVPSIGEDGSDCFRTAWSLSPEERNNAGQEPPLWLQLYQSLLCFSNNSHVNRE